MEFDEDMTVFSIYTEDFKNIGAYYLVIHAFNQDNSKLLTKYDFTVILQEQFLTLNAHSPYFAFPLVNQVSIVNQYLIYKLPQTKCKDSNANI
jgi:hypothetical protein